MLGTHLSSAVKFNFIQHGATQIAFKLRPSRLRYIVSLFSITQVGLENPRRANWQKILVSNGVQCDYAALDQIRQIPGPAGSQFLLLANDGTTHTHGEAFRDARLDFDLQMLFGGAWMLLVAAVVGELPRLHFNPTTSAALLYLILAGSVAGYAAYAYALKHLPVSTVSPLPT